MPLVVAITRDVEERYHGFLGSTMLALAPGVYAQPRMSAGVRTRILAVLADWHGRLRRGSIVVCWADTAAHGCMGMATFGEPPRDIVPHDGMLLVRRALATPAVPTEIGSD